MQRLYRIWGQQHLSLSTKIRLYTTLVLPFLLYASETWTTTKLDLAHLQAFHIRCQRHILGVCWQDHITNSAIQKHTFQPDIGRLIQARKHSLLGHVVCIPQTVPCNAIPWLTRDISMGQRISPGWRRRRRWSRASWTSQLKGDTGVPTATSWRRAVDRQLGREDATALTGYAIWLWWYVWTFSRSLRSCPTQE